MFLSKAYYSDNNCSPFCVLEFNKENFETLLKCCTLATQERISTKAQVTYIYEYLKTLGTATILIESNYLDKAYLEDYSEYYVKCFKKYQREVNRFHFFTKTFNKADIKQLLNTGNIEVIDSLKNSYLGFITIKKLPDCFVGNTCLKTFDNLDTRHYSTLRDYKENIFGIDFSVAALAFQEQDSTVSACATSSLWSIFNATGKLFQHSILSPVEITKLATEQASVETRIFPNKSLNFKMIAQAIKNIGLEPYKIQISSSSILKASIYAYLKAKIPMLLGFGLYSYGENSELEIGHAVACIGYNLDEQSKPSDSGSLKLYSDKIDKIYVHDDQVGPYAKMEFIYDKKETCGYPWALSTSYGLHNGEYQYISLPWALSIPLYRNIRIPFENIYKETNVFNRLLHYCMKQLNVSWEFEWDIYLNSAEQLKSNIVNKLVDKIEKPEEFLTNSLPSYIWCCELMKDKEPIMNIIFDATDIEHNLNLLQVVKYKESSAGQLYNIIVNISRSMYEMLPETMYNQYVRWFSSQADYRQQKSLITN